MGNDINSTEIARLAGVSRSTVSRVINNYPNVPEGTRRLVLDVIERHNYYPNLSAQVLAGKRARTIGLFMIDAGSVSSDSISNLLLSRIIESASSKGYFVLTHIVNNLTDREQARAVKECFYQRRIDGGIFIGAQNEEPLIEELVQDGFIVGIVDQSLPKRLEPNRIIYNFDNIAGVESVVDYLTALNHSRIGIINGDLKRHSGLSKRDAFVQAMEKRGLELRPEWMLPGDFNDHSGYAAMNNLLRSGSELPTAIFAANDSIAFGAIKALREVGIAVPEELSIIGFDDHLLSSRHHPPLSTIRVNFPEMLDGLTCAVIDGIENGTESRAESIAGTTLIVRESCSSPRLQEQ